MKVGQGPFGGEPDQAAGGVAGAPSQYRNHRIRTTSHRNRTAARSRLHFAAASPHSGRRGSSDAGAGGVGRQGAHRTRRASRRARLAGSRHCLRSEVRPPRPRGCRGGDAPPIGGARGRSRGAAGRGAPQASAGGEHGVDPDRKRDARRDRRGRRHPAANRADHRPDDERRDRFRGGDPGAGCTPHRVAGDLSRARLGERANGVRRPAAGGDDAPPWRPHGGRLGGIQLLHRADAEPPGVRSPVCERAPDRGRPALRAGWGSRSSTATPRSRS